MKEVAELQQHWENCQIRLCPVCVSIKEAAYALSEYKELQEMLNDD